MTSLGTQGEKGASAPNKHALNKRALNKAHLASSPQLQGDPGLSVNRITNSSHDAGMFFLHFRPLYLFPPLMRDKHPHYH